MAFFNKLKSVFGFSNEDFENEINDMPQRDATVTPLSQRRVNAGQTIPSTTGDVTAKDISDADSGSQQEEAVNSPLSKAVCPEAIFTKVVEIFNESLPPFLRENIDRDKQAAYIHEALDASMKEYIARLDEDADARMKAKWESGQTTLRHEMETLREKAKKIEDANNEWKVQKLSAERQKRALSERVHDLEKQIDAFQAEKEQYELENKSLVNKLRAMSIQDEDTEALRNDNEALRKELKELKENTTKTVVPAVDQEKLKELDALNEKVEDLQAQRETLIRERTVLTNDIVVLKKKCEISDAMLNDLNHKASSAKVALAEKENQYKELLEKYEAATAAQTDDDTSSKLQTALDVAQHRQEEIETLQSNIESAHAELQRVNTQLHNESAKVQQLTEDLRVAKEEVEESRSSLTKFEEALVKIDEINEARQNRIAELQNTLKEKDDEIAAMTGRMTETSAVIEKQEKEIADLKTTIDNNLQLQIASEALLREEIERLRKPAESPRQRRKRTQQISSIDDSLDDTNWLVSTPPEGTNARPAGVSDAEFGYQAPQHREEPNNPAQMSLW